MKRMKRRFVFAVLSSALVLATSLSTPLSHAQESELTPNSGQDAQVAAAAPLESITERGPVRAVVSLAPPAPLVGDTLTVTLEVTAEKYVELLMPEFGQALERFPIVDFFPEERLDDAGRTVSSQRYSLELTASGKASIPPLIIEFVDHRDGGKPAPEGEDAYELLTERVGFEVQSVVPKQAAGELKPPMSDLALLHAGRPYWIAGIAAVVLVIAGLIIRRVIAGWTPQARRESAYDVARARLAALVARPLPGPDNVGTFFVELSDLIRRYLEDRFELRAPELTTEEFLTVAAASPDLSAEHKGFLRDFLQSADMVKFARFVPGEQEIGDALNRARHFLDQTRDDVDTDAQGQANA